MPVLSMFFLLTSAAGSALWAADQEDEAKGRIAGTRNGAGTNGAGAVSHDEQWQRYRDAEEEEDDDPV